MASETLIVKAADKSFSEDLLYELMEKEQDINIYLVSTSSLKRKLWREKYGRRKVLNPFESYVLGEFKVDILWVDEWPSLMGEVFEEFNMQVFNDPRLIIATQSYEGPSWASEKLKRYQGEGRAYIYQESCPRLPLWPHALRFLKLSKNTLKQKFLILRNREKDFHVGLDLYFHSYFMNYAQSHRLISMNSSRLSIRDYLSILLSLYRFLRNELRLQLNSLVDYFHEYED